LTIRDNVACSGEGTINRTDTFFHVHEGDSFMSRSAISCVNINFASGSSPFSLAIVARVRRLGR